MGLRIVGLHDPLRKWWIDARCCDAIRDIRVAHSIVAYSTSITIFLPGSIGVENSENVTGQSEFINDCLSHPYAGQNTYSYEMSESSE